MYLGFLQAMTSSFVCVTFFLFLRHSLMSQKTLKRGRWSVQQWETCARGREVTAKGLRLLWPYETDAPFVFSWLSCRNTTFLGDWCHFVLLILQIMCKCAVSTFFLSIMPSEARLGCTQEEIGRGEVGMQSPLTVFFFQRTHYFVVTESLQ